MNATSTYDHNMPRMFPSLVICSEQFAAAIAAHLISARPVQGIDNGSSFAVTSDTPTGVRKVWLSKASFDSVSKLSILKRSDVIVYADVKDAFRAE
jgi:hypothetical protein